MESGASAYKRYLQEITRLSLLTHQEELDLAARCRRGDEGAREAMITANLRLVVKIARDYEGLGLPLLDLISEGNCGLMKAVDRYRAERGAKLSSYASWWIKQSIRRALANQSRTIRLPVHLYGTVLRMRRVEMRLQETLGRSPSSRELARQMEMPADKVAHLLDLAVPPTSLDDSSDFNDTQPLGSRVADPLSLEPHEVITEQSRKEWLSHALAELTPRESKVLCGRFGLENESIQTLDGLGAELGLTRESIRQIQKSALKKLRRAMKQWEAISDGRSSATSVCA